MGNQPIVAGSATILNRCSNFRFCIMCLVIRGAVVKGHRSKEMTKI